MSGHTPLEAELYSALCKASIMLRRAANTAKTVALTRDLDRQADEMDAIIRKAKEAPNG